MSRSDVIFDRWKAREDSTWPFQVFKAYNLELEKMFYAQQAGHRKVYQTLGSGDASWTDQVNRHFEFNPPERHSKFRDLKDWSNAYNQLQNWTRLNFIMAICSNLETYISTIIGLALESDPGILLGSPKLIDGVKLLKEPNSRPLDVNGPIMSCTKGDWQSRANGYRRLFGKVPEIIEKKMGDLEKIRNLRNRVGHAFGRDLEESRKHGVKSILPMENLTEEATLRSKRLLWSVAKCIDVHLLNEHIGEFQALNFYHELFPKLRADLHPSERAIDLKKAIGRFGAIPHGKTFCKGIVNYYESL